MLTCDEYLMPETLAEALNLWSGVPDGGRLVAGATDLLPWAREGRAGDVHLPVMVDLSRIAELDDYRVENGRVRLGANLVYQRFLTDPVLRENLPCMPFCAVWFADDQIREQATLAGNIVNASPAADGTPPVLALNGEVEVTRLGDRGGEIVRRQVAVADFVHGPGKVGLEDGEIVTAITCDALPGYGGAFEKVGQRRSLVISVVCAACLVKPTADGATFDDVRLALGGIGPVPIRLDGVEIFLKDKPISMETIEEAVAASGDVIQSRTRREYRRTVVDGFIRRALIDALADCGIEVDRIPLKEVAHV